VCSSDLAGGHNNSASHANSTLLGGMGQTTSYAYQLLSGQQVHWAKFDANGKFLGASDPGTEYYANSSYALVKFPGVDMDKCAIGVQPKAADGDPAVATYSNWYGWIYARTQRITASGPRNNGQVALDVIANCGQEINGV
jgi:hypothetical protein